MANTHPSEETIERFAMNRLTEPELESFEEHLLVCPRCQDEVARMDEYLTSMKTAARQIESEPHQLGFHFPKPAWVALAATLVIGAYFAVPRHAQPPQAIVLTAMRGSPESVSAKPGIPIHLRLTAPDLNPATKYTVYVVDAAGSPIVQKQAFLAQNVLELDADALTAGQYWVRVNDRDTLIREYSLLVR